MNIRITAFFSSIVASIAWITILTWLIPKEKGNFAADLLLDLNTTSFSYPFTIQNLMWIVFFIGVGELSARYAEGSQEHNQLDKSLLPEDDQMFRKQDLASIYRKIRSTDPDGKFWLQRLLSRSILAFQVDGSIGQVNSVFSFTIDLCQHEVDLRYNMLKYLVWLIPTLGFIGTVVGIALALQSAGEMVAGLKPDEDITSLGADLMITLTEKLGVAFYTTLLALLQSAVLMFAMHLIQGWEERTLNKVGQYCLDNLINRLYEKK